MPELSSFTPKTKLSLFSTAQVSHLKIPGDSLDRTLVDGNNHRKQSPYKNSQKSLFPLQW
jgi:hypothetical protein